MSNANVPRLTPGPPKQMLAEAIQHLRSLPFDAARRADEFEALAAQIETESRGLWKATRGAGTDGSEVFLGRQGEGLVIAPDGRLYRGSLRRGIRITSLGLEPNYNDLTPLD